VAYHAEVTEKRQDTRSAARVKVDAFVKVSGGSEKEYVFRTRDLSKNGLFLYTKVSHIYPIKVGTKLTLELYDYDHSVVCQVVVARIVEPGTEEAARFPSGFGVRIVNISDAERERLEAIIHRLNEGQAELY
jgi:hypothetical protein